MAKKYILTADDVIDNLTSEDTSVPLSANQGKVLKTSVDSKQDTIDSEHKLNADYIADGTTNKVYTSDEQTKLEGIETGAQVNKIETIKANGTALSITNKSVNIPLATVSNAGLNFAYSSSRTVFVSPDGDDTTGDGTSNKPWREIQTAINKTYTDLTKRITIRCESGNYSSFSIRENEIPFPDYELMILGDVIITGSTCYIINNDFVVSRNTNDSNYTISFITDASLGIVVGKYGTFTSYVPLDVTASDYGIDANGIGTNVVLWRNTNITLTSDNPLYGIVIFNNSILKAVNINVNSISEKGIALRIEKASIGVIESITSNITNYSLLQGGVLSIGSQWVDQSGGGGGGVWGQITGDINTQTDLTSFVNNKPTILSGTSEPTPEQGKTGDIYVRYNV